MYVFAPCIIAQESYDLKEWSEIECTVTPGPDGFSYDQIWGCYSEGNHYIIDNCDTTSYFNKKVYEFKVENNSATLKPIKISPDSSLTKKPLYINEKSVWYESDTWDVDKTIRRYFIDPTLPTFYDEFTFQISFGSSGQLFMMSDTLHFLSDNNKALYKLTLVEDDKENSIATEYKLDDYPPKKDTTLVVLGDKCYYFSDNGFCSVQISEKAPVCEKIDAVTVTNEKSLLMTDNSRIWIVNSSDGVIEYDTKKATAKQIALFPSREIEREPDFRNILVYEENSLYLLHSNGANKITVYHLDVTPTPEPGPTPPGPTPPNPDPDNPVNPVNPEKRNADQSGKSCGCLGIEFLFALAGLFIFRHSHKN